MIVDTSAILAILFDEGDAGPIREALAEGETRLMSVASYIEAGVRLVHNRASPIPRRQLDRLIRAVAIRLESVTIEQGRLAIEAYRDFGKGSGSKAQLNYGDCFAYALAKDKELPLLFKGSDFSHTDIRPVL